jgi:hypothetical protein
MEDPPSPSFEQHQLELDPGQQHAHQQDHSQTKPEQLCSKVGGKLHHHVSEDVQRHEAGKDCEVGVLSYPAIEEKEQAVDQCQSASEPGSGSHERDEHTQGMRSFLHHGLELSQTQLDTSKTAFVRMNMSDRETHSEQVLTPRINGNAHRE